MPTIGNELKTMFNEQAGIEFTISNIYLALSFWFEERNYTGVSKYLKNSSNEEREHGLLFFNYILKRNGTNVNVPVSENYDASIHKDALEIFKLIYDIEVENTVRLTNLADFCLKVKDYQSYNFLKPLLEEQDNAENEIMYIISKLEKNIPDTLYFLDKDYNSK